MNFVQSNVIFNGCIFSPQETLSTENCNIGGESFPLMERSAVNNPGLFTESSKINTKINWGR